MPVPERGYLSTSRAASTTFGAMNIDQLRDLIAYSRQVLELLLAVSSIFGGFAITGVVALRAEERRDRLHATAFFAFSIAALAFIGATALDAIWLPVSRLQRLSTVGALSTVLSVSDTIVWLVLVGAASLVVAVGTFGFARSRRMGVAVACTAALMVAIFVYSVIALARVT